MTEVNSEFTPLTDEQVTEIEKRIDSFPLSPFQVRALCATVKHLRHEGEVLRADLKYRCEALEELRRCRDRWLTLLNPADPQETVDGAIRNLQSQLEQLRAENERIKNVVIPDSISDLVQRIDAAIRFTVPIQQQTKLRSFINELIFLNGTLRSCLAQVEQELAEEKRLRAELKQIAQIGISEVSSVGTTLKDNALIDFRSRAIQLCKDKAAEHRKIADIRTENLNDTGAMLEQVRADTANEIRSELEKL